MSEEIVLDELMEINVRVAEKMGLKVVHKAWNCQVDPESGQIEPYHYIDPDFKEGYTGIMHLRHPVYLENHHELITFEDGSIGTLYEKGGRHISWPPHFEKGRNFQSTRLVAYGLEAVPHYSTDIKSVWEVVKFVEEIYGPCLELTHYETGWLCEFRNRKELRQSLATGRAETERLAICKAFLGLKLN